MKKYVLCLFSVIFVVNLFINDGHAFALEPGGESNKVSTSKDVILDKKNFDKFAKSQLNINREMRVEISHISELYNLMNEVYIYLPNKVIITTSIKKDELTRWISLWEQSAEPEKIINKHTLANYTLKKEKGKFLLLDNTNDLYSARVVEKSLNEFALLFSKQLEGKSSEEKFNLIYNFIFKNYSYSASSYKKMLVGNMGNDSLACNGFSRLFYELSKASGLDSKIIKGDDHFWNRLYIGENKWITVDLSTDILLKKAHASTGTSRKEHEKLNEGNFYSSKYKDDKYKDTYKLSDLEKSNLIKF